MIDTTRSPFPADMDRAAQAPGAGDLEMVAQEALDRLKQYARQNPTAFGLCALGVGFVLGWRLKPW